MQINETEPNASPTIVKINQFIISVLPQYTLGEQYDAQECLTMMLTTFGR